MRRQSRLHCLLWTGLHVLPAAAFGAGPPVRACIQKVDPQYPQIAREIHVQGTVVLDLTVEPDGRVASVTVVAGHPILAAAARDAAVQWRYAPGPDEVRMTVRINFKL